MSQIDDLKAAVSDIVAEVAEVNASIDKVIALLGGASPDVAAAIDALKEAKAGLDAAEAKTDGL